MKTILFFTIGVDQQLVGFCHNGLFCVDMNFTNSDAGKRYSFSPKFVDYINESITWHTKLGHIGTERMTMLARNGLLGPLTLVTLPLARYILQTNQLENHSKKPSAHQLHLI